MMKKTFTAGKNRNMMTFGAALMLAVYFVMAAQVFAIGPELDLTLMRTDPDPVISGTYFEVVMKVENIGEAAAKDVVVSIDPQFPFTLAPGETEEKSLGTLLENNPIIVRYKLFAASDAVDGLNDLKVSYSTGSGISLSQVISIDIESKKIELHIGALDSDPVKLISDTDSATLSVDIQNTGDADAYMVSTQIILPEGFTPSTSYSDRYMAGTIAMDSSKTATYYVDIAKDVEEGIHKAQIVVNYKDKTGSEAVYREVTLDLDLPVKGKPDFEIIEITTDPVELAPEDTDVKLKLRVKNTGSKKAESVSINIFKKAEQPIDFDEKSDYIGTLDAGDEGYAILTFSVDKEAELKEYLLDAEIRAVYEDTVHVYDKTVPISVTYTKDSESFREKYSAYYPAAGVVLALLVLAYLLPRAKKKKDKSASKESKKD